MPQTKRRNQWQTMCRRGRPASSPSPLDVGGAGALKLWLRVHEATLAANSDGSGGVPADTQAVGYVSAMPGTLVNGIQASAGHRPTLSAAGINSKRALNLGTGASHLHLRADAIATSGNASNVFSGNDLPNTIFCVVDLDSTSTAADSMLAMATDAAANRLEGIRTNNAGKYYYNKYDGDSVATAASAATASTDPRCITARTTGTSSTGWVNGGAAASTGWGATAVDQSTMAVTQFGWGARPVAVPSSGYRGLIAEILVYNVALTNAEIDYVHAILAAYYGLTIPTVS